VVIAGALRVFPQWLSGCQSKTPGDLLPVNGTWAEWGINRGPAPTSGETLEIDLELLPTRCFGISRMLLINFLPATALQLFSTK